jgi:hypothetical protein
MDDVDYLCTYFDLQQTRNFSDSFVYFNVEQTVLHALVILSIKFKYLFLVDIRYV